MTLEEHAAENRARGDFPLEPTLTASSYFIEVPVDKFSAVMQYEADGLHYGAKGATLYDRLEKETQAEKIEYDGFFGCYVYYTLDKKYDTAVEHNKIIEKINAFIEEAQQNTGETHG